MVFSVEIRDGSLEGKELKDWQQKAGKLAQIVRAANFLADGGDINVCTVSQGNVPSLVSVGIDLGGRVPYWADERRQYDALTGRFGIFDIPSDAISFTPFGSAGVVELDTQRFDVDAAYKIAVETMKERAKKAVPAAIDKVMDKVSLSVICGADGKPVDPESAKQLIAGIEQRLAKFKRDYDLNRRAERYARPASQVREGIL